MLLCPGSYLYPLEGYNGVQIRRIGARLYLEGGVASEQALARMRFYPDGTCDRVRLDVTRTDGRKIIPIDPLTCAPLPAVDAK